MGRRNTGHTFAFVRRIGLALGDIEAVVRYDGATVLKSRGCFVAGLASHPSAEPDSLVVRYPIEQREWLLTDAPETYYLTPFYERYPLVLVRLAAADEGQLRELLSVSKRMAIVKARRKVRSKKV